MPSSWRRPGPKTGASCMETRSFKTTRGAGIRPHHNPAPPGQTLEAVLQSRLQRCRREPAPRSFRNRVVSGSLIQQLPRMTSP